MSTPVMVTGYTNVSLNDGATTSIGEGDGVSGFWYYSAVLWHLTRVLLLCGATCTGSSTRTSGTGTAANAMTATDQWSTGAYNTAYQGAWWACTITIGGIVRNFVFQSQGTTFYGIRAKMTIGTGNEFTNSGGSVSATRTKAVTGEEYLVGGGTDASPTYVDMPALAVGYYLNACWDSATGYLAFAMTKAAGSDKTGAGFVFALLPLDTDSYLSTRDTHVVLCSPGYMLTATYITESSTTVVALYQCRKGISGTDIANVKPAYRVVIEATAADPGTGDKIDGLVSWKRDTAPVDTGGLTSDCIVLGSVTSVPTMHDVRINPNSATVRRYLCLGDMGLRFPNSFVSN